jgi:uncharacterized protein
MVVTEIAPSREEMQSLSVSEDAVKGSVPVPVERRERISSIDIVRGFALLGILVLNIGSFAGPEFMHDIPIGIPKPPFVGPHAHLNFAVLLITWILFEGKMRCLFSMLFGAGVILFTARAEKRGAGIKTADLYTRRNLWLCVFGLIHGTFLWYGDILFMYGLSGLLFLFPFRVLKTKTLFVLGLLVSIGLGTINMLTYSHLPHNLSLSRRAAAIEASQHAGRPLSAEQKKDLHDWKETVAKETITQAKTDEAMADARAGYLATLMKSGLGFGQWTLDFYWRLGISDPAGTMLLGMALFKMGFFTAELSYATYLWTAILGLLISVPLYIVGLLKALHAGFYFITVGEWIWVPYPIARIAGAVAIAAILMIVIKTGVFRSLLRPFAAVGQTALSNYLLTTVMCQTVFLWGPWKLYGSLEYYQYFYVVLAVWAVNLVLSSIWLRFFQFGPVEWLWRSLTYWKVQPMRIAA